MLYGVRNEKIKEAEDICMIGMTVMAAQNA